MYVLRCLLALAVPAAAAERGLELRGRIEPAPGRAAVAIHGALTPFSGQAFSDSKGRFTFRNLVQGAYTIAVFLPGYGEVIRTVDVTSGLADAKGRVSVVIPFDPPGRAAATAIKERGTVSVKTLAIPGRAQAEYQAAQGDLARRDTESAKRHLERAVELAPHFMLAWNNLGTIAYQTGRHADAEKYFRAALERDPGAFYPVVNLGGVLLNLGKLDEALKYNEYAVRERPHDALANSQLGMTCFLRGDSERALKHLTEAKRLDPGHFSQPQLYLARIYAGRGDAKAAARELEEYVRLHPDAPESAGLRRQIEQLRQ